MSAVAALDLGTTRIKGALFEPRRGLLELQSRAAPRLTGDGVVRESSAGAYRDAAAAVLERLLASAPGGPTLLGIASQRSTFTLWDTDTGEPVTPLISWQDRRAAAWCDRHRAAGATVRERTGLLLSPHYAGPKLAALVEQRPDLREGLAGGRLRFGTLDAFLLSCWSGGRVHETDRTIAARTLLADPAAARWLPEMLELFSVPERGLPAIRPTRGRHSRLDPRLTLTASIADQASGALASLGDREDAALINLGTGGFVLAPTGNTMERRDGYLSGPLLGLPGETRYALEGTINGAATAVDRFGEPPTGLPQDDPAPQAFALPDAAGVGSPYWIAERGLTLSAEAERLDVADRRRVVAEGIVFRVRQILDDLRPDGRPILGGGLARDPFFAAALAACLARPVELLREPEATLLGAAWLASSEPLSGLAPRTVTVRAGAGGAYLRAKYPRWRRWLATLLGT